ncbi:MAG TPA: metalloprotease TldD [Gammaproteobacteria bacterium]|nr:metalloprotease TldD [Gammaproteobacteria bacterium]
MTGTAIDTATETLLAPTGIEIRDLENVLRTLAGRTVDIADLYFECSRSESWSLEDGIVKEGSYARDQGVGVRAVSGEKTGFAYSDELALPALRRASETARAIARQGQSRAIRVVSETTAPTLYAALDPLASVATEKKLQLLRSLDNRIRNADGRVREVIVSLTGRYSSIIVAASDGTLGADHRPLVRLNVNVIVEQNGHRESASYGGGGRTGYDCFFDHGKAESIADEALRQALVNLDAGDAPAGEMRVVLAHGWPGILLHEAIGHGLEGDFNRKGTSAFANRVGERVANENCTVVDDATLIDRRGSLAIDDEGVAGQNTTLIEKGVLRGYLQDKHNARLMGVPSTGNGRRQSYSHRPMPRMTNTYMLPGKFDPQEIVESVDKGLYAVSFGGGQVDITNGKFVFSASEAYLIENGKVTAPVKGATLIGDGPDVLTRVSMIGNDLELDNGVGTCGKNGQQVPVGVGQPTLRIDDLTVGGTNTG